MAGEIQPIVGTISMDTRQAIANIQDFIRTSQEGFKQIERSQEASVNSLQRITDKLQDQLNKATMSGADYRVSVVNREAESTLNAITKLNVPREQQEKAFGVLVEATEKQITAIRTAEAAKQAAESERASERITKAIQRASAEAQKETERQTAAVAKAANQAEREAQRKAAAEEASALRAQKAVEKMTAAMEASYEKEAKAAERARSATDKIAASQRKINEEAEKTNNQWGKMTALGVGLMVAKEVISDIARGLGILKEHLIDTNAGIETMRIGLAAVINAHENFTSSNGRLLGGVEAFNEAQRTANTLIEQFQIDQTMTAFTTEHLAKAAQILSPLVLSAGKGIAELRAMTLNTATAASVLNIPLEQAAREVDELLSGRFRISSPLAVRLGLSAADREELKKGTEEAFAVVTTALGKFQAANEAVQHSWAGLTSSLREGFEMVSRIVGSAVFDSLKGQLERANDYLFPMFNGVRQLNPELKTMAQEIGSELKPILDDLITVFSGVTTALHGIVGGIRAVRGAAKGGGFVDWKSGGGPVGAIAGPPEMSAVFGPPEAPPAMSPKEKLQVKADAVREEIDKIKDTIDIETGSAQLGSAKNITAIHHGIDALKEYAKTHNIVGEAVRDLDKEIVHLERSLEGYSAKTERASHTTIGKLEATKWLQEFTGGKVRQFFGGAHGGIDIAAPSGAPVRSLVGGVVSKVYPKPDGRGGVYVTIDDGHGHEVSAMHLQLGSPTVVAGQTISQGDIIGRVGRTGHATGPHIHYQVGFGSKVTDPLNLVRQLMGAEGKAARAEDRGFATGVGNIAAYAREAKAEAGSFAETKEAILNAKEALSDYYKLKVRSDREAEDYMKAQMRLSAEMANEEKARARGMLEYNTRIANEQLEAKRIATRAANKDIIEAGRIELETKYKTSAGNILDEEQYHQAARDLRARDHADVVANLEEDKRLNFDKPIVVARIDAQIAEETRRFRASELTEEQRFINQQIEDWSKAGNLVVDSLDKMGVQGASAFKSLVDWGTAAAKGDFWSMLTISVNTMVSGLVTLGKTVDGIVSGSLTSMYGAFVNSGMPAWVNKGPDFIPKLDDLKKKIDSMFQKKVGDLSGIFTGQAQETAQWLTGNVDKYGREIAREQKLELDRADELAAYHEQITKSDRERLAIQDQITKSVRDEAAEVEKIQNEGWVQRGKSVERDKKDRIAEVHAKADETRKGLTDRLAAIDTERGKQETAHQEHMASLENTYSRELSLHTWRMTSYQKEADKIRDEIGPAWAYVSSEAMKATQAAMGTGYAGIGGVSLGAGSAGQGQAGSYGAGVSIVNGQYVYSGPSATPSAPSVPNYSDLPIWSFDVGGDVPGPRGWPQQATVHGGESIATVGETSTIRQMLPILHSLIKVNGTRTGYSVPNATMGGGGGITVNVDVSGNNFPPGTDPAQLSQMMARRMERTMAGVLRYATR